MSRSQSPTSAPRRYFYTLDEMMGLRAEARRGRPFRQMLGAERFHDMASYEEGYACCCEENGFRDQEYGAFTEWLRDSRRELPEGWRDYYVEVCEGDHEKAMMRMLDFAAEFRELHGFEAPSSPAESPPPTSEHATSILEVMLRAHEQAQRGYPLWLCYGTHTLPAMSTHIRGYLRCCERNGFPDARWYAFSRWLDDDKGLQPDTWVSRILQDCEGNHEKAMRRMLDIVAEYVHEHERPSRS